VNEYFLPHNLTLAQAAKQAGTSLPAGANPRRLQYRPVLLAQASVRFLKRNYNLDYLLERAALVTDPDRRGVVRWEDWQTTPIDPRSLDTQPAPQARFAPLQAPLSDTRLMKTLEADFVDWLYRAGEVQVWANETIKLYAGPEITEGDFRKQCAEAARTARDAAIKKVETSYKTKLTTLQTRLNRERRELDKDKDQLSARRVEEAGTHLENVIGLLGGRSRRVTTSLTKRRMTSQARANVKESEDVIAELETQIQNTTAEIEAEVKAVEEQWGQTAADISQIPVTALKKDILLDLFGVAWLPVYLVEAGGNTVELEAYGA
jgi:hypothetical protein